MDSDCDLPDSAHQRVLAAAVKAVGGTSRSGQVQMADAVADAFDDGVHLLVQAGTGTGKSLAYLVPAALHAIETNTPVVVATATLALQRQLAQSDLPNVAKAVKETVGRDITYAVVKGRSNYACLLKTHEASEDQDALLTGEDLLDVTPDADDVTKLGSEVLSLRQWVANEETVKGLGDCDDAPSHSARAWSQVSVAPSECIGAARCPFGQECFAERAREQARSANIIITNHALLAVNALHGGTALPEHGAVVIDEAHELLDRMTSANASELDYGRMQRLIHRVTAYLDDDLASEVMDLPELFKAALDETELGQISSPGSSIITACDVIRSVSRRALSALSAASVGNDTQQLQVSASLKDVFDVAQRLVALSSNDVVWVSETLSGQRHVRVAPLSVAGLMREEVLSQTPCVFTSATLTVGGEFQAIASSLGLVKHDRIQDKLIPDVGEERRLLWRGLDVGTPFDYARQGILYVASDLPTPGRDGIRDETLHQIAQLLWAAQGRTLGLFASQRAAEAAASYVRQELPSFPVLCQGDAQLSELTRRFAEDEATSLFGTLSLWQGIDIPGDTCQLVIIDKIPFPRPDDPLMKARQDAVTSSGGNGFMQVAATQAGLLLAQGSGRLIRRTSDRGVVAILDPRLVRARYGSFLQASMPDFWMTTDYDKTVSALRRLSGRTS